jgi:hypothetical protein
LVFLSELKRHLESQLDDPSGSVSCVLAPHQLTIYYRGASIGSWHATEEGASWHGAHERDVSPLVMRDVYDATQVTLRALFLFVRDVNNPGS